MKTDIIYRCYEGEVDGNFKNIRPKWFNKLACLKTFLKSLEKCTSDLGEVLFVHDGIKGKVFENIPKNFNIVEINNKSNELSLLETFNLANKLSNNIYFVEDDYLHLPQSIDIILKGIQTFNLVTGYDHLDRYIRNDDLTLGKDFIAFSNKTNSHWRTSESTCCTWGCSRIYWNNFIREAAYNFKLNDREFFRFLYSKYNIRLWNPIPAVTTQVDDKLSPSINWEKFSNENN